MKKIRTFPLAKPYITDKDVESVNQVLMSSTLSRGPKVKEFEQQFKSLHECEFASAVSSGTAGLILGLQALGVEAGDEVITVSFTVPATVNSILALGAVPKMIDIEADSLGMCPNHLQQSISAKTKAIIAVHAFGKAAKIKEIMAIAASHKLPVIEDACEAVGNQLDAQPLGSFADLGVFGFYPNKQITTGEGGMVVTDNSELYERIELLKNHGRSMSGDWLDQQQMGWNFRMSELNAALGVSQMQQLTEIKSKRQQVAQWYEQNLGSCANIKTPLLTDNEANSAWFVYVIRVPAKIRDKLAQVLAKKGIQCGKYFAPVHLQPFFAPQPALKVTEKVAHQCLALPFYYDLSESDVEFISDSVVSLLHDL